MAKIGINIATGSLQKEEMIVGIDLGTTNSLVAIIHPETRKPVALKEHDGSSLVPSIIYFSPDGQVKVGEAAIPFLLSDPKRTIFSAKRLMGKRYDDLRQHAAFYTYKVIDNDSDGMVKVQVDDQFYSPVELSSLILKELKLRAEHILKTSVSKAVITVPAYFNDTQRQATRDAGKLAGLDVLRIINEPTAASLAYGLDQQGGQSEPLVAVYDLGGGTFDISILRISDGVFEVLSTNGDTYLGGDDIDRSILNYWAMQLGWDEADHTADPERWQQLRLKAELAKKQLSDSSNWEDKIGELVLSLTRENLEALTRPLLEKTLVSCAAALKDAGIKKSDLQSVVMVGGSTRMPMIREAVSEFFGLEVNTSVHPDEVVALGAAIQADILAGNNRKLLLLDIMPLSLGIETAGGLMDVLIPRNSKIPSAAARQYTTQIDGQSGMRISVFQGERDLVKDNRKLAEFNLAGIPGMPAGIPKVEVSFLINADGILTVSAKELRSGVQQNIQVVPREGLTDEDLEKMLMEAISHAKEDIALRALTEAQTEAEQLLKTTERFLQKHLNALTQEELLETANAMQALQLSLSMEDKNLIQTKIEALNEVSKPYAERIMDEAVGAAMKGKTV
ncbi:MAG: Fe-S protein assembly chaperone HscA [Sphingobacteriales bacterium]|jgi:molecular chaperone HscA|nr:Fe-S protein assembly chaperone HscA [Sphingobacteriales bacterium]